MKSIRPHFLAAALAINQLHRNPIFTGTTDAGKPPYLIARIWTGTKDQPGR